jgi:hypothetical protein
VSACAAARRWQTSGAGPFPAGQRRRLPREHELIGEATLANAILDRLLDNAHRLALSGESMRRSDATTA